jgi:membrane protein insertase Oxa1/YidC/SpoIIIJ
MMTWMMPIMMAIFSFMYTSAFSIYIIINTGLSILTTIIINKLVERKFSKENPVKQVVRGRVYVQNEQTEAKTKKDKKEVKKEEKIDKNSGKDFLTGLADGKQPTKKLKRKK